MGEWKEAEEHFSPRAELTPPRFPRKIRLWVFYYRDGHWKSDGHNFMQLEKKCFVVMPFSKTTEDHDEKYWENFF